MSLDVFAEIGILIGVATVMSLVMRFLKQRHKKTLLHKLRKGQEYPHLGADAT